MEKIKNYLVVWHNLNNNTFYVKAIHGHYRNYTIGYINQYNHKVVYIYDIRSYSIRQKQKKSLLELSLSPLVAFLKLLTRLLEKLTSLI